MRRTLVAGNWKSNGRKAGLETFLEVLGGGLANASAEVLVCPPYVYLSRAVELAPEGVSVGAQNCSVEQEGAFTGEVTAGMLADCEVGAVILGHSERRELFSESSELVASKVKRANTEGLMAIVCVGESLEEREKGLAEAVVLEQVRQSLQGVGDASGIVLAYEPVWAIGTGKTASAEDAQDMHAAIRRCLREQYAEQADSIRILYGGSVKGGNAAELFAKPDIDGALVGGASLDAQEFLQIIAAG